MVGRPRKYFTEVERKHANQQSKNKYILNKEWRCPVCDNHDYKMAGKWKHLNSLKHKKNMEAIEDDNFKRTPIKI